MSENSSEEISVQRVFIEVSKYLKNEQLFERLLNTLHEEPNYKQLLKTGEDQFFDAPNKSSTKEESIKSMFRANYLADEVEKDIDKIVQEKFQGEFLDYLKNEVLQAVLQLYSEQVENSADKISESPVKNSELEPIFSPDYVQNRSGIKKEENNITNGQAGSSLPTKPEQTGDPDVILLDDVSSVHTSDLSSFEDEISLSSDEELGEKKRLSLKEVQEKLEKSQLEKMESDEDDEQDESNQAEDAHCSSAVNGNEKMPTVYKRKNTGAARGTWTEDDLKEALRRLEAGEIGVNEAAMYYGISSRTLRRRRKTELSIISQKSQRSRKPNLKYCELDDLMLLKRKSIEEAPKNSRSVSSDTPRKRGRPRKHSTQLS